MHFQKATFLHFHRVANSIVTSPEKWRWSSYQATAYSTSSPAFLSVDWILLQFAEKKNEARKEYRKFVADGMVRLEESPWKRLVGQIVFGGAEFVAEIQSHLSKTKEIGEFSRAQRFVGRPPLGVLFSGNTKNDKETRNKQIDSAYMQYGYTLKEIADQLDLHYTTVSKVLKNLNN